MFSMTNSNVKLIRHFKICVVLGFFGRLYDSIATLNRFPMTSKLIHILNWYQLNLVAKVTQSDCFFLGGAKPFSSKLRKKLVIIQYIIYNYPLDGSLLWYLPLISFNHVRWDYLCNYSLNFKMSLISCCSNSDNTVHFFEQSNMVEWENSFKFSNEIDDWNAKMRRKNCVDWMRERGKKNRKLSACNRQRACQSNRMCRGRWFELSYDWYESLICANDRVDVHRFNPFMEIMINYNIVVARKGAREMECVLSKRLSISVAFIFSVIVLDNPKSDRHFAHFKFQKKENTIII